MQREIERRINDKSDGREVKLSGKLSFTVEENSSFTVGRQCVKGIISVMRPDVVIDGSDAEIEVFVKDSTSSDWSLFFVRPSARNVRFRNLKVRVHITNPEHSSRMFSLIYNTSYGLCIEGCDLTLVSDTQLNMAVVYNNGNFDTHMNTRADNLIIRDSSLYVECSAEEFEKACAVYGLYNNLANSISVQNTFVYATLRGNGERQKAVGVYTDGRFGRFVGNNIKANGLHNDGTEKEQAHAFGFINEGLYSVITSNNIVGEWAGMGVGLENKGAYTLIESNKILATHTICGRSVRNYGDVSQIHGNILTSTSRNARLLEQRASSCIISQNIMEVLMTPLECRSGFGIYAIGENCAENIITENLIRNVMDCGIFTSKNAGTVAGNRVVSYSDTISYATEENEVLLRKSDERLIRSIRE